MCDESATVRLRDAQNQNHAERSIPLYWWVLLTPPDKSLINEFPQLYLRVVLQQFYPNLKAHDNLPVLELLATFLELFGYFPLRYYQGWERRLERAELVRLWCVLRDNEREDTTGLERWQQDFPACYFTHLNRNSLPVHRHLGPCSQEWIYSHYADLVDNFREHFWQFANTMLTDGANRDLDQSTEAYRARLLNSRHQVFRIRLCFKLTVFARFQTLVQQLRAQFNVIWPGVRDSMAQFMARLDEDYVACDTYGHLLLLYLNENPGFEEYQAVQSEQIEGSLKLIRSGCLDFLVREEMYRMIWPSPAAEDRDLKLITLFREHSSFTILAVLPEPWLQYLRLIAILPPATQLTNAFLLDLWIETMIEYDDKMTNHNFIIPEVTSPFYGAQRKICWLVTVVRMVQSVLDDRTLTGFAGAGGGGGGGEEGGSGAPDQY